MKTNPLDKRRSSAFIAASVITLPILLVTTWVGCKGSGERAPTPPLPAQSAPAPSVVASTSTASSAFAGPADSAFAGPADSAFAGPADSAFAGPADSAMAGAPVRYAVPPTAPPKDLGPEARPVRFTKHLDLKSMADLPKVLGGPLDEYGSVLEVESESGGVKREVKTCNDFFRAFDDNLHGDSYEMTVRKKCQPLWFLHRAWPSRTSHVADLKFDVPKPLELLSADFDVAVSVEFAEKQEEAIARGDSLLKHHPKLFVTKKDAITLDWKEPPPDPLEVTLEIVAFGDIDHDGIEDVLFSQVAASTVGSYRMARQLVMTRKTEKGPLVKAMSFDH